MITIPTSDLEGMTVAEFDTRTLLEHAAQQARQRQYEKLFIVDVDSHHYETSSMKDILKYMEEPVLRQMAQSTNGGGARSNGGVLPGSYGYQDQSGRVTRYPLRPLEKTAAGEVRDVELSRRWMDSMGIDIAMLFPTPMLGLGFHPLLEMQVALARAYNRWLVETVLAAEPRIRALLYLPLHDADASYKMVEDFGDRPGVSGFVVVASNDTPVNSNPLMKVYAALEERNLPIAFHAHFNWRDSMFRQCNRFISTHALGFTFYNIVQLTNWVVNGIPERFPKLKTIWMESGLAWIPFMMQRLDNEYLMRSNECPLLKKKPSEYMREFYYSSQPMELGDDIEALKNTFRMINAETQLLYSSDYPHWDFDLPSTIYDLPFLTDNARSNILGGNAARVFNLEVPKTKLARIPEATHG
jgi:predicted TIM-barrel fold metal-dependent hydrolase